MTICSRLWENRERQARQPRRTICGMAMIFCLVVLVTAQEQAAPGAAPKPGPDAAAQAPAESQAAAPLRVMVGKSILINTTERIRRVSVTDAAVADPIVVAPTQILV